MKKKNTSQKNILTLAIPTRNYIKGVKNIILELKKKKFDKVKIIFFENSTNDDIYNFLVKNKKIFNFDIIRSNNLNFIDHWNKILQFCDTDYLLMLHHDEIIPSKTLDNLITNIEKYKSDFYIFKIKKRNSYGEWKIGFSNFIKVFFIKYLREIILYINYIGPMSAFCFKVRKNYYFDPKIKYFVDMHIFYQVFLKSMNYTLMNDYIISDSTNRFTITNDLKIKKKKLIKLERKYFNKLFNINFFKNFILYKLSLIFRLINALIERVNKTLNTHV